MNIIQDFYNPVCQPIYWLSFYVTHAMVHQLYVKLFVPFRWYIDQ